MFAARYLSLATSVIVLALVICQGQGQDLKIPVSLRACCELQSQYDVEKGVCTNGAGTNVSYPRNFTVPRQLSMSAYPGNLTEAVNLRIQYNPQNTPKCSSIQFEVTASFNGNLSEDHDFVNLTTEGYLKYGKDYFSPNEYCVNKLNSELISLVICSSRQNCTASFENSSGQSDSKVTELDVVSQPCIRRCCEFGQVYDLSGLAKTPRERLECKSSGTQQWMPKIYEHDPYKVMSDEERQHVQPHFVSSHPRDGWCDPQYAVIIPLNDKYMNRKEIIRILKDGTFMRKTQAQTWIKMDRRHFCIEGAQNYPGYFDLESPGYYTGDPQDTIILDCTPGYVDDTGIGMISSLYGASMLFSSIFLLLTVIVYFLLWEKQNVHGWTILCYALSLLLAYIFMAGMHFSKQLNLTQGEDGNGSGPFCRVIAVCIHFFFISTFTWLTVINFDLWWTFKVLKPTTQKSKGIKRFICYSIFALGLPAAIVSVALALDFTYRDDIESDVIIPLYGQTRCYMNPGKPMFFYLYGPIGILLAINLCFFLFTIFSMYRIQQSTKFASSSSSKSNARQNQSVKLFLKLFIIMGVSWIFEVISWYVSGFSVAWYWTIFDLFNIFQAIIIFIIFVCKKETVSSLEQKYPSFKRFTNSVKMEAATVERLTTRYPRLKRILSPCHQSAKTSSPDVSRSSNRTDSSALDSEAGAGDGRQKVELKLEHQAQPSQSGQPAATVVT